MMTKKLLSITAAAVLLTGAGHLSAAEGTGHWSYGGKDGPEHWGEISPDYNMCRQGRNQSPINISGEIDAELPELVFDYYSSPLRELNNGHTIVQNIQPGSSVKVPSRDTSFELKQFHFHSPSEHTIEGKSFAMELHFVHANDKGELAVVGVMIDEGKENEELGKLWAFMPEKAGDHVEKPIGIEETKLLPPTRDYYYYSGSLTTPPCSEGVSWVVLKTPIEASAEQVSQFKARLGATTNRPIQSHNARIILD